MKIHLNRFLRFSILTLSLFIFSTTIFSQTIADKQRQFDFWIGEWDVNLRVLQKDNTWQDKHKSVARIYSILDGKAILELWSENEKGINGYSLRYFNATKNKWDLWLNWASNNNSATSGLQGTFRHGRGEFFSERKIDEKTTLISRYAFSDATPNSLRWDDGYSRDGGKTWSSNWIMEFTRKAKTAPPIGKDKNLLTYFKGTRCNLPQFNALKQIWNSHQNNSSLRLYNIMDGCLFAGFIEQKKKKAFFTLTYNTFAKLYELTFLDDKTSSVLGMYYGTRTTDGFEFQKRGVIEKAKIKIENGIKSLKIEYENKTHTFKF